MLLKKIIIVINSLGPGGAERIAALFANYLVSEAVKVEIIVLDNIDKSYEINENVSISYLRFGDFFRLLFPIAFILQTYLLYKILKKQSRYSVYAFLHRAGFITALASHLNGSDFVYSERSITDKSYSGFRLMIMKFFLKFTYRKAKRIIAISSLVKRKISEIINVESKVLVIPNPIDSNEFFIDSTTKISMLETTKIIVIGRLIKSKRVDAAIHAFEQLSLSEPSQNFTLDILGNGAELNNLKGITCNSKFSDSISFLGHINKPAKYLRRSHICLICSEYESFGNIALEAISCGTVVVYPSDLESMKEIFSNSSLGVSYQSRETESVVVAIKNAMVVSVQSSGIDYENFISKYSVYSSFTKYMSLNK
jgi:glycosyltransferase involved in cell wall biosynthesis